MSKIRSLALAALATLLLLFGTGCVGWCGYVEWPAPCYTVVPAPPPPPPPCYPVVVGYSYSYCWWGW